MRRSRSSATSRARLTRRRSRADGILAQRGEHRLRLERLGLVVGHGPARAGLAAAHGGDHLEPGSCGRGCPATAPRTGPGAPGSGRPSRGRPGRPTTTGRPAGCAAPGGRGGPAGRSGRPRRGRPRAPSARGRGPRAAGRPRARRGPRPGRRGRRRARRAAPRRRAAWPTASTPHQRAQGSSGSARSRATAAAAGRSRASSAAARPVAARGVSPIADDAASSATWRQRPSVPRAGAGPAAAMNGSTMRRTVADVRRRPRSMLGA